MTMQTTDKELAEARLIRCLTAMMNTATEGDAYILKEAIAALRTARQATPASASEGECPSCTQMGVFATDGSGPYDCYACGKPATPASASEASEPMTGELLPCPFCGKSNQDRWPCEWLDGSGANVVRCAWCHGAAPMSVWNRRHPAPASGEGQQGKDAEDRFEDYVQNLIDKAPNTRMLGERLADWLDEDRFNNVNPQLLALARMEEIQQQAGQAVAIVGAFGSVSWMSGKNLPIGTNLYMASNVYEGCPPSVLAPVLAELARATTKFPTWPTDPLHALAVLGEEFGELTRAVLQVTYEPHKATQVDVAEEAIQTAAMALRFVMSWGKYQYLQCDQHQQMVLGVPDARETQ